jgi:nickel/cobalt exporter
VTLAAAPLLAAAGVALGHAVLPDHWVPLAVVGRTRRYPLTRIARLSSLAGIAHVLVSLVLGAVIIAIGLQFRSRIEDAQNTIVGLLLIGTGIAFAIFELSGRGHRHAHEHPPPGPSEIASQRSRLHGLAGIVVPFGAAASPDLTILPVFLAATAAGTGAAVGSLVVFAVVTIATIVVLTVAAAAGSYQLRAPWLERWGNAFTAAVLIVLGTLVLTGVV